MFQEYNHTHLDLRTSEMTNPLPGNGFKRFWDETPVENSKEGELEYRPQTIVCLARHASAGFWSEG
jgi:hypothetical protein